MLGIFERDLSVFPSFCTIRVLFVYGDIGFYSVLDMFVGFMKLIYNPKALRTRIVGLLAPEAILYMAFGLF